MKPVDLLVVFVIALILAGAIAYIIRAKKKGVRCIGCPDGGHCSGSCSGCAGCHAASCDAKPDAASKDGEQGKDSSNQTQ